jgi:HlyD family secretion protein
MAQHACLSSGLAILLYGTLATGPAFAQSQAGFTVPGIAEPQGGVLSIGTAATGVVQRISGAGERIRRGEELVKIDCAPLEASVASLAGQSQAAQAVADRVRNGPRPEEIAVGEANVGVARARAEEAADDLQRAQRLQIGISITQAARFQIERAARITDAQLEDALAKLKLLRIGSRAEDIAEADARRDAAKAALDEARARLAQCSVTSPIDGIVLARFGSQGQFVSAAVPMVLLELADDRSFAINAEIDEARLSELCLGQQASVSVLGQSEALAASVAHIAPKVALERAQHQGEAQGRVAVSLDLARQDTKLRVGQAVTVHFEPCRR